MKYTSTILTLFCMPMLACSEPAAVDGGGTSGEPEASTSASIDASTSGGATDAVESSSTATSEGTDADTTSSPPGHVCGDGLVEAEEACDDGNEVDADGCNRDCAVSGSLLWSFGFPFGLNELHSDVDSLDRLHVLGLDGEFDIAHFVFSPEGELVTQEILDVAPPSAIEGLTWDYRNIEGFRVYDDAPVFAFIDVFFGLEGEVDGMTTLQSIEPAWTLSWGLEGGNRFAFDVADDGRVFGMRGGFVVVSAQGTVLATGPDTNAHWVAAGGSGAAFAGRDVTYYGEDGSVAWSIDWPSGVLTGAVGVDRFSDGDVVVYGEVGESIIDESQLRLARYSVAGAEISTWTWPKAPAEEVGAYLDGLAISPQGHITILGAEDEVPFLWKMNEDYSTRWKVELEPQTSSHRIISDSRGAIYVQGRNEVSKYAP